MKNVGVCTVIKQYCYRKRSTIVSLYKCMLCTKCQPMGFYVFGVYFPPAWAVVYRCTLGYIVSSGAIEQDLNAACDDSNQCAEL